MKKLTITVAVLSITALFVFLYLDFRPVKIIAIHQDEFFSHVIVNHMPLTKKQKIRWWQNNKYMLLNKYNVPQKNNKGMSGVYFWEFGEGYKELGKYDRYCFDDMPEPTNCIEKVSPMFVDKNTKGNTRYTFEDSVYIQTSDRGLQEEKHHFIVY